MDTKTISTPKRYKFPLFKKIGSKFQEYSTSQFQEN